MTSTNHTDNSRKSDRLIRRRLPRRDESGLTTLEWLLIVAAVAGLAALAVVLVTNVVSDTGEQIEGQGARRTAVVFAAQSVIDESTRAGAAQPDRADTWAEWAAYYTEQCSRLRLTYGDVEGITITPKFVLGTTLAGTPTAIVNAAVIDASAANATALGADPAAARARAHCWIS